MGKHESSSKVSSLVEIEEMNPGGENKNTSYKSTSTVKHQ